jgi:hypothetical protein
MKTEKEKKIRRIAVSISKESQSDVPLNDIEEKVESIISTGVSESKAKEVVPNIINNNKKECRIPDNDEILLYNIPSDFEDLFIDPR